MTSILNPQAGFILLTPSSAFVGRDTAYESGGQRIGLYFPRRRYTRKKA